MHPVLREGEYVYVLWPYGRPLAGGIAAAVREAEGLTVVLPRAEADSLGLPYDFVAAWITLQVHSSLEADRPDGRRQRGPHGGQISCNVLAGFHHDHLLVPVADATGPWRYCTNCRGQRGPARARTGAAQRAAGGPARHPGADGGGFRRLAR